MHNQYDLIAEQWHAARREFKERRYVDMAFDRLRPGDSVVDVGCGTGVPIAQYLIRRGLRVVGVDRSRRMLEIARAAVPELELVHGDMLEAELGTGFSAAVMWDSLFHVERAKHQAVFRKLSGALKPRGRLLLSAGGSGDEGFTSRMFGHTFFYSGHEPEETVGLLEAEGFEVEQWEVDEPSSRGHVAIIAEKVA